VEFEASDTGNPVSGPFTGNTQPSLVVLLITMIEMIAFAGILAAGLAVAFVFGLIFMVLKLVFWTVFLPFRILFKLLWIPFGLVTGAIGLAAGAALLPILLVVGGVVALVGLVAAIISLLIPAIPFLLLGLVVWAFMRREQPPAIVS
jgi:hypothetical protein